MTSPSLLPAPSPSSSSSTIAAVSSRVASSAHLYAPSMNPSCVVAPRRSVTAGGRTTRVVTGGVVGAAARIASSRAIASRRDRASVTSEATTILVPGNAARAKGHRFMPMTMVSSHARVSLSTAASSAATDEEASADDVVRARWVRTRRDGGASRCRPSR